jgi:hypothetical protein
VPRPVRLKKNSNAPFGFAAGIPPPERKMNNRPVRYDTTQELRAAILGSLPYPPIPVSLSRIEEGSNRLGGEVVQTTHDLLSVLLSDACVKHTVSENMERQEKQKAVLQNFLRDLVRNGLQPYPELYQTYCSYSLQHISTYAAAAANPDICFLPHDHVCKGDRTHLRMCDYMAGQARILQTGKNYSAQDWAHLQYSDMILCTRALLVEEEQ